MFCMLLLRSVASARRASMFLRAEANAGPDRSSAVITISTSLGTRATFLLCDTQVYYPEHPNEGYILVENPARVREGMEPITETYQHLCIG